MKKLILIISLIIFGLQCRSQALTLDGSWEGKYRINPELGLRLVINISGSESENPVVTLDSPDQGAYGIPMSINYISSDSLNVEVKQLMLNYKGKIFGDSIPGEFSQGPIKSLLTLRPKKTTLNRPQTPKPPFSYLSEEVSFPSALDGADLYGTLSLPSQEIADIPVVLLVSGSGTQNRDEEIFEHKPFAVIADYLARNGVASLRYDDRGFDKATGLSPNPTTQENAMDALGGINFLKEKGFTKIGIIGHSEGGLIADKIASESDIIDFIIEIGGPAVPGDSILIFQNEFLLKDGGLPDEYIAMYIDAMKGIFESQKDVNPIPFDESNYEIFSKSGLANPVLAPLARNLKENFVDLAPWLKYFINYNPVSDLKKILVPILMIYGENDTQVPPSLNVPVLKQDFPEINVKVYPQLNHLMQHSKTGKITEYADIEETISPEVLEDIKDFILSIK
ncbi:MAG: alpha/beta fold hydrolase [Muribaculaceae bacterium]|nr:alpha/beta fold hydrolase [Muribaculaceae bacterium]